MAAKAWNLIQQKIWKRGTRIWGISIYFAKGISGNVLEMVNQLWASLKDEILKLDKRKGKLMTIPQRITRGFVDSLHVPREKEKERFVT